MELLPQLAAVVAVFALLGLTLWWLKKRGAVQSRATLPFSLGPLLGPRLDARFNANRGARQGKLLEHLDSLALSPTHALNVVRMGDRAILIGTSPSGFYVVESHPWKALQTDGDTRA